MVTYMTTLLSTATASTTPQSATMTPAIRDPRIIDRRRASFDESTIVRSSHYALIL